MIGHTVSHYKIVEELGGGGMGVVYKAEDTRLKRTVALKFLPLELTRDESAKTRFIHEAQAASALQHNNICTIHEIDETPDGRMFICMDCYEGQTLKEKIAEGPLPVDDVVNIAIQLAEGLAEAHEAGMVHRDIKPANIVVTQKGDVKILDFGLAKLAGMTKVTRTGMTVGTVAYMSPEQARGADVDHRSDIWSFGVVLYELLTGSIPFKGTHEAAILYSIQNTEPESLSNVAAHVPPALEAIVADALTKEASHRPQSMDELVRRLRAFQRGGDSSPLAVPTRSFWASPRGRGALLLGIIVVTVMAVFAWKVLQPPRVESIGSIAVLPLENLTGDTEQEFFVDGMTEALTAKMAQNSSIKVISRTSAMRYKNTEKLLPEIASELGVDAVIEGSVFRFGDSVRVTTQLIDARSDAHLWSNTYDRSVRDVLAMQSDIAQAIFAEVHVRLSPNQTRHLKDARPINPVAMETYLKGRFLLNKRTRGGELQESVLHFDKTVDLEPDYAPAYAAMASAYSLIAEHKSHSPEEYVDNARKAARRALELDKRHAEAIAVLANIAYIYEWDWSASEKLFRQAIAIDPNDASIHTAFCEMLRCLGRFDEALSEVDIAQTLDPLSPMTRAIKAWTLVIARRYDEAIAQGKRAIEMDEQFYLPNLIIAAAYEEKGDYGTALEWLIKHNRVTEGSAAKIAEMEAAYATSGADGLKRFQFDQMLLEEEKVGRKFWYARAGYHVYFGESDQAIACLERALDKPMFYLTMTAVSSVWDPLRSDPRFQKILERMGLQDVPVPSNSSDIRPHQ